MNLATIETKVWAPALAGLVTTVIGLLVSLGFDIPQDLQDAVLKLLSAAVVIVTLVTGYLAPHTDRQDLWPDDDAEIMEEIGVRSPWAGAEGEWDPSKAVGG